MSAFSIRSILAAQLDLAAARCEASVWGNPDPQRLLEQNLTFWGMQPEPLLLVARDPRGEVLGFRYAHSLPSGQDGVRILYDQNGGVAPAHRRRGICTALLREQHRIAAERGFGVVRTGVAFPLKPMILLNLKEGFDIVGTRWDTGFGVFVLMFEKRLA